MTKDFLGEFLAQEMAKGNIFNKPKKREEKKEKKDLSFLDEILEKASKNGGKGGSSGYESLLDEIFPVEDDSGYGIVLGIVSKYLIKNIKKSRAIEMIRHDDSGKNLNKILMVDKLIPYSDLSEEKLFEIFDRGIALNDWADYLLLNHKDYLVGSLRGMAISEKEPTIPQYLLQITILDIIKNPNFESFVSKINDPEDLKTVLIASNACSDEISSEVSRESLIDKLNRRFDAMSSKNNFHSMFKNSLDEFYFMRAKKLFDSGDLEASISNLKRLAASDPLNLDISILYSKALYQQGDMERASSTIRRMFSIVNEEEPCYKDLHHLMLKINKDI